MAKNPAESVCPGQLPAEVFLAVDRFKALSRGVLWSVVGALCGGVAFTVYSNLTFVSSGVSNRLVDYAIAALALPIPLFALFALFKAIRWLILGGWPEAVGVAASEQRLEFRLGPFRRKAFDSARIRVRYPFELAEESEEASFEAYLPEEEQMSKFLPRMTHPDSHRPLNERILEVVRGSEADIASRFRGIIRVWRVRGGLETD